MNEGKPFDFDFAAETVKKNQLKRGSLKIRAIGTEVTIPQADGTTHVIKIIAPESADTIVLHRATNYVLRLPQDLIPSINTVELMPTNSSHFVGLASANLMFIPKQTWSNLFKEIFDHEFGHNLAYHIWNTPSPGSEWVGAVKKDGQKFVTSYAKSTGRRGFQVNYSDDFADSVKLYLNDQERFHSVFPNRSAVLDTIFRDKKGTPFATDGAWHQIRNYNQKKGAVYFRAIEGTGFY